MKSLLTILTIATVAVFTSCSSNSYPTRNPYPNYPSDGRDGPVVVTRDGTVIDRNGRVVGNTRNMPPGQAKKIYGSKSAKPYAPGQRKKAGRAYVENDGKHYKSKGKKH
jgi:hypothetical protein